MADDEKNETTEETPEPEAVTEPESPEANQTPETETETETEAEPEAEAAPAAPEAVTEPDSPEASQIPETEPEAEAAPAAQAEAAPEEPAPAAKKQPSLRHVPRSARRTRTKTVREKPATRKPITRTEKPVSELGRRQERRGVVVSDKGDKTIVVKVDVIKSHAKYKKVIRRAVKFHAHDEANQAGVGDMVRIVETRPLSKTKRWRLAEIVEKAR
jgi:small subunit ribosomal protein S17